VGVLGGTDHALVLGAVDPAFRRQVSQALRAANVVVTATADVASLTPPRPVPAHRETMKVA
jgi:hypothetical protein